MKLIRNLIFSTIHWEKNVSAILPSNFSVEQYECDPSLFNFLYNIQDSDRLKLSHSHHNSISIVKILKYLSNWLLLSSSSSSSSVLSSKAIQFTLSLNLVESRVAIGNLSRLFEINWRNLQTQFSKEQRDLHEIDCSRCCSPILLIGCSRIVLCFLSWESVFERNESNCILKSFK